MLVFCVCVVFCLFACFVLFFAAPPSLRNLRSPTKD